MLLFIFCTNFTDPIAEIPHPHLVTSPVSEALIFFCAFLKLYFVTYNFHSSEFNTTVLHSDDGIVRKTTSNPKLCLNIKQQ